MADSVQVKAVMFSDKTYHRLLALYPAEHRREYGPAMAQLFRDQCRDAWRERRWSGLARLWLRVLPDLFKTSLLEHLTARNERKSMFNKFYLAIVQRSTPTRVFVKVFLAVALFIFLGSAVITMITPQTYSSTARILVERDLSQAAPEQAAKASMASYDPYFIQTEFEIIQSQIVLNRVIEKLDLNKLWGKKYFARQPFKPPESLALLKSILDLRPVRNTSLIEIRAYSDNPAEAALIANSVAENYRNFVVEQADELMHARLDLLYRQLDEQTAELKKTGDEIRKLRSGWNLAEPEPPEDKLEAKFPAYAELKQHFHSLLNAGESLEAKLTAEKITSAAPAKRVVFVEQAVPGLRPIRPNVPLNLVLGAVFGILAGTAAGAGAAGITLKAKKNYLANLKSQGATA